MSMSDEIGLYLEMGSLLAFGTSAGHFLPAYKLAADVPLTVCAPTVSPNPTSLRFQLTITLNHTRFAVSTVFFNLPSNDIAKRLKPTAQTDVQHPKVETHVRDISIGMCSHVHR